ncbi:MAG TPA: flagellar export protein FliJ [bacterium]|nr:flagellar export protein FliJ [bacterium]
MGFTFKLQRVLDLRLQEEEAKKNELAMAEHTWRQETAKHEALSAAKRSLQEEFRGRAGAVFVIAELVAFQQYQQRLEREISAQAQQVAQARAVADARRAELLEAAKKRKALEKLKDRRAAQFKAAEEKAEQNDIDDQGMLVFMRQRSQQDVREMACDTEAQVWWGGAAYEQ